MKKRIISIGISMALILGACGCEKGNRSKETLYEQGLEVISLIKEMANDDAYLNVIMPTDDMRDVVEDVRKGDFSEPKAVYKITIPKESTLEMIDQEGSKEADEISNTLKDYIHSRMSETIINHINTRGGTTTLAVSSILSGEKIFVNDELTENAIYLYTYESATPVAILFNVGEDGAVLATGRFILYDGLNINSKQEIEDSFEENLFDVEVEVITK